jgi:hypothetical protein
VEPRSPLSAGAATPKPPISAASQPPSPPRPPEPPPQLAPDYADLSRKIAANPPPTLSPIDVARMTEAFAKAQAAALTEALAAVKVLPAKQPAIRPARKAAKPASKGKGTRKPPRKKPRQKQKTLRPRQRAHLLILTIFGKIPDEVAVSNPDLCKAVNDRLVADAKRAGLAQPTLFSPATILRAANRRE